MNNYKNLPLLLAAFSLLILFNLTPAVAQSDDADTLFNCTWSAAAVVPTPLLDTPAVAVGGNLYIFGGVANGVIVANAYRFDGSTWTPIAPLPTAVEFPAAVTDGTNCYILGGALTGTGTPQTTLYRYNVATNTYTTLAPFTTGTWNHAAVYLGGKIYKFTGTGPLTASTNVLEIYDVASNTWSAGAPYPITESFVSAWGQGTFIYAAGGIDGATSVATAKTYRYNTVANTWDDASIADLPFTRWGAAAALYTDGVLAGGYVNGTATANISNTVISWDLATNTWQTVTNMLGERARMTGAVLGNSFYVIGGRSMLSSGFTGTNDNQKLLCLNAPTNIMGPTTPIASSIISAGNNGSLDPSEVVTVALGVQNVGGPGVVCTTAALTGTLLPGGGVTAPSGPQNYGVLCSQSAGAYKYFSFTVDPALSCGSTVTATLQLQDGATNYGTIAYTFTTGITVLASSQNFDGVVAPALPAGWTSTATGIGVPWVTSTTTPNSAPNDAFAPDPANVGDSQLISAAFAVPAGGATLSFKNNYITESTFDGEVLEISINGGAYADIITAGGTFVSGGYNATISTAFMSPIAGRMAWSGTSAGGYITSTVNLPAAANGQMVQLKWRMASDNSVAATGVWIDDITVFNRVCGGSAPTATAVSRKTHAGAGDFDVALPIVAVNGTVGIEPRNGPAHTMRVSLGGAGPWTVGSAAVTYGTGSASASVAGNVVTVNLTGVTDVQRLAVTLSNASDGVNVGNIIVPMGLLNGDVSGIGNGSVNSTDVSSTKAAVSAGTVNGSTFRADVNFSGTLTSTDIGVVKTKVPNMLPP